MNSKMNSIKCRFWNENQYDSLTIFHVLDSLKTPENEWSLVLSSIKPEKESIENVCGGTGTCTIKSESYWGMSTTLTEYKYVLNAYYGDSDDLFYITLYPKDYVFVDFYCNLPACEEWFYDKDGNELVDDIVSDIISHTCVPIGTTLLQILEEEKRSNFLHMAKYFQFSNIALIIKMNNRHPYKLTNYEDLKTTCITEPCSIDISSLSMLDEDYNYYMEN